MGRTAVALALSLTGALAAQQRSPAFVTAVDAAGKPLANAQVTCVFTPDDVNPWPRDVVLATTDARGRARCDLQARRLYVTWVVGAPDAQGACLASDPLPLLAAGRVVELRALDRRAPRRVTLRGHDAWRNAGAVALRWLPDAREDVWCDLAWPEGGDTTLPPSPSTAGCLALIDANGEMLATTRVAPDGDEVPELAAPMKLAVAVTDSAGAPLAGAAIEHPVPRFGGAWALLRPRFSPTIAWRRVGITAADGTLATFVPTPAAHDGNPPPTLLVRVHKAGFAMGAGSSTDGKPVSVALARESEASIAVSDAASAQFDVGAVHTEIPFPNAPQRLIRTFPVDGTRSPWLVRAAGEAMSPRVLSNAPMPTAFLHDTTLPRTQFVFERTTMRRVEIHVRDADNNPVACAIAVGSGAESLSVIQWGAVLPTDAAGRAAVFVPSGGSTWFVYATTGSAHDLATIGASSPDPLVLRLAPFATMRVRAVGADGAPIAGARVAGQSTGCGTPRSGDDAPQWQHVLNEVWWSLIPPLRTDADGQVAIPAFGELGIESMAVLRTAGRTSESFGVRADKPLEVRLK